MHCSGCAYPAADRQFDTAVAERDLRRYRKKGLDATSGLLLTGVAAHLVPGDSVLDVGGGVGVLDFELLSKGASKATLVDASPSYLEAARGEARRRDQESRVRCVAGDFVGMADTIESAEVVTMHRVVCCYPNYVSLLEQATSHSRRLLAFSYPRDRWFVRWWVVLDNLHRRIMGKEFRTFVHPPAAMERIVERAGFRRLSRSVTFVWSMDTYSRASA